MNRSSRKRRHSYADEEVCSIRVMAWEKALAMAGVVRDNALAVHVWIGVCQDLACTMRAVLRVPVPRLTASTIGPDGPGVPAP
jgi:hypothetical protein